MNGIGFSSFYLVFEDEAQLGVYKSEIFKYVDTL